ncbi:MAG: NAD(P)H-binding protein [Streptosporangiaceae bacterium]
MLTAARPSSLDLAVFVIIVNGATGQLGRGIVEQLLARVPADQVGVSVRDPGKASAFAARGVRVRRGDFADPATLSDAFEGASQVLIVSVDELGDVAVARHAAAIEAARAADAQRILYTSHMGAAPDSPFAAAPDHAATEALLRDSGVPFTSLRNGFYANTATMLVGQALQTGTLTAPEDGPVSWTAPADLAEAAAIALSREGALDGITPPLAGAEAVDLTALAAIASDVHGRQITRVTVSEDEYRSTLIAHGTPERFAEMFLGMFRASRRGDFACTDPALQRLIGHPPTAIRDVLAKASAC